MTQRLSPAVVDRSALAGIIPMVRAWYDCGNGYGVSTVVGSHCCIQAAAGLWMDRRPGRLRRRFSRRGIELLHTTPERVHIATEQEALALVEYVAALPPLGAESPPERLLPDCEFWWCAAADRPCTRGEAS